MVSPWPISALLAKPARLAIVPWLLVFFIDAVSLSRCSAARRVAARGAGGGLESGASAVFSQEER